MRNRICATLCILLTLTVMLTTSVLAQELSRTATLEKLRELQRERKWQAIVEQFGQTDFAAWPQEHANEAAEALALRGQSYGVLKKGTEAEADFKAATKLAPKNASHWLSLADNYAMVLQDDDKALAAYRETFVITGRNVGWQSVYSTVSIARVLTDKVQSEEALKVLDQFGDLPGMAPVWKIRMLRAYGAAYASLGREAESLAKYREALELESPQSARPVIATPANNDSKPPRAANAEAKSELFAGTAKIDITPAAGSAINLVGQPLKPNEPLYARVLVLKDQRTSVAIVTLDLIVFASKKVIENAKAKWGVEHVILSATHTHAAAAPQGLVIKPPMAPDWTRNGKDPGSVIDWDSLSSDVWYASTEQKVIEAIGRATQNLFPARLVAGKGPFESAYMAHNRRLVRDGRGTAFWENPDRRPTQPVDPTIGVIRVEDLAGKPRAFAVHYACHPVAMMGAGVVSRDFPGATVDHLEEQLGKDCLAMFLQGAQGDIDPYDLHNLRGENRSNMMRQSGISLAKGALRIAADLKTESAPRTSLRVTESLLSIPYRNGNQTTDIGIATIMLSPDLALVAIPGEPFIQHQLDLRAKSPIANTFLLGIAYHGKGSPFVVYIPTVQAVKEGGYGATECSFVAADAGERMVAEAVARLRELTSKLQ